MKTESSRPANTPLPWRVERMRRGGLFIASGGGDIAQIVSRSPVDKQEQDAAMIVRAINNHDVLLFAAKQAADLLAKIPAFGDTIGTEINKAQCGIALRALVAAISAATEQPKP